MSLNIVIAAVAVVFCIVSPFLPFVFGRIPFMFCSRHPLQQTPPQQLACRHAITASRKYYQKMENSWNYQS